MLIRAITGQEHLLAKAQKTMVPPGATRRSSAVFKKRGLGSRYADMGVLRGYHFVTAC
jgi:hypothetical protein